MATGRSDGPELWISGLQVTLQFPAPTQALGAQGSEASTWRVRGA